MKINYEATRVRMSIINKKQWLLQQQAAHPDLPQMHREVLSKILYGDYVPGRKGEDAIVQCLRESGFLVEVPDGDNGDDAADQAA